ncbi:unnamed protein product [Rotaria sp. Silwood2]|nr:unnamed protein product [Rotaria sp. Silwood2]
MIGLAQRVKKVYEIEWGSIDNVASFMTLVEELAITVAQIHCEPPLPIFPTKNTKNFIMACKKSNDNREIIRTTLSSFAKQKYLMKDIRCFSMIYAEIARRDHEIFFRNFRNANVFKGTESLNDARMLYPLVHTRREAVLIVGGGIGGLATALSFAQAGIRVRLVEKNNNFREVGAGMQLAPNCSRLLDRLGVLQQVQANAVFPKQIVWMDALSGERLTCLDLGPKFVERFGYPYIVVHRADLLNALYEACIKNPLVTLETNRTVVTVDERPKSIMLECTTGMRYDCDMVVAADGLWSALRKYVCDDGDPLSVGYVTYRGTVGIDQVSKESGLENVQFWIGPDMHIVQYPVRRGQLFNQAAVFKSKLMPDHTDQWGTKEELNERFSTGCDQVKKILSLLQTNFRWPVYDRNPLSKWSRGRLVLVGDAAHPMLQYAAQGAAQAIEDACALADAYKKHGPSNIEAVFHEYEQERIPLSSKVVHFARAIGDFAHQSGNAKTIRDEILCMHDMHDFDCITWLYEEKRNEKK